MPPRKKSGYLPSLDGWRAFAILGVMITHDLPWIVGRFNNSRWKGYGGNGVYLFFAISGILICTRILEEEAAIGRFRIKAFYIRRIFRIQPAALVYLATIAALMLLGIIPGSWHQWRGALFLYNNFLFNVQYATGSFAFTGHFWTLSLEEHFYIILSLLLFCFRRHRIQIFAGLVLTIWAIQQIAKHHGIYPDNLSSRKTYWAILYLLTPALLALLLRLPQVRSMAERFLHPWVAYLITLVLMIAGYSQTGLPWAPFRPMYMSFLGHEAPYLYFGFSLWVIATMLHPRSLSTRILELPPIRLLGRLSYSIYLWHILFFISAFPGVGITWRPLLFLSSRPWKYIASFAAAALSYYFIEKPLIRVGHRIAPPVTPGHKDLEGHGLQPKPSVQLATDTTPQYSDEMPLSH